MAWAKRMGLANKDNYLKQPLTMLAWRSISAAARLVCSEALYGVQYTPDELAEGHAGGSDHGRPGVSAAAFTPAAAPQAGQMAEVPQDLHPVDPAPQPAPTK